MRRPSRPLNQKSRSGRQSIGAAPAVLTDIRKSRFLVAGSIRTISIGFTAISQLATAKTTHFPSEDGIGAPTR
jgi:hypothetical protein